MTYVCRYDVGEPKPPCPGPIQSRGTVSESECVKCLVRMFDWEHHKRESLKIEVNELEGAIPILVNLRYKILQLIKKEGSITNSELTQILRKSHHSALHYSLVENVMRWMDDAVENVNKGGNGYRWALKEARR